MANKIPKYILSFLIVPLAMYGAIQLFSFSKDEVAESNDYQHSFNTDYKIYALNIPSQIAFANETVPLQLMDVNEKLDRELLVNTYWQSNTLLYLKRANKYFPIIEPILKKNGIPEDFKYLAVIESGLTPIVSPAGAAGFWQIMKTTGKEMGLEINSEVDERYHVAKATEVACKYLNDAYNRFGSWTLAAASYNMGMGGLNRQLTKQKVDSYYDLKLNSETGRYVYRIMAAKEILSDPNKYGFQFREDQLWNIIQTEELVIDTTVADLAVFAKNIGLNYKILKEYNPWLRSNKLTLKTVSSYTLDVPKKEFMPLLVQN
ncbi:MAG: lytic transglycosylase domain-containing protein [Salibacteraceae bacterium]